MKKSYLAAAALAAGLALPGSPALAQANEIVIGITIVTTGPAAALGIPERNSLEFVAKEIGGVPLKVIVLDDGVVSSDLRIELPAGRSQADPAFALLRTQLLAKLGVEDDRQIGVDGEQRFAQRRAS